MLISPTRRTKLSMFFFLIFLIFSCNKDSDLLIDYVLFDDLVPESNNNYVLNDNYTTSGDATVVLDVLVNDKFPALSKVQIIEISTPFHGTVAINEGNSTISYTPTIVGATGQSTDTFTYTTEVVDEDGSISTEVGTVQVILNSSDKGNQIANLLFSSGFEGVQLSEVAYDYQYITGTDAITGFSWPPTIWGSNRGDEPNGIHLINDTGNITNEIQTVTGHLGRSTSALYTEFTSINKKPTTQSPYQINNIEIDPEEYYIKFWMKLDDLSNLSDVNNDWRMVWQYKSDDFDYQSVEEGYRISIFIYLDDNGNPHWHVQGDDQSIRYWEQDNYEVPVPTEEWFSVEVYSKVSSGSEGRFWARINGTEIANHDGANLGNSGDTMSFMMLWQFYGSDIGHQWIDDIEIWDGIPN